MRPENLCNGGKSLFPQHGGRQKNERFYRLELPRDISDAFRLLDQIQLPDDRTLNLLTMRILALLFDR